jgi:hypothetical protein
MAGKATSPDMAASGKSRATAERADRLKAALKANIARRKAQAAARGTARAGGSQEPDDNTPRR